MSSRSKKKLNQRADALPPGLRIKFEGDLDTAYLFWHLRALGLPEGLDWREFALLVRARVAPEGMPIEMFEDVIELLAPLGGRLKVGPATHSITGQVLAIDTPLELLQTLCGWPKARASAAMKELQQLAPLLRELKDKHRLDKVAKGG